MLRVRTVLRSAGTVASAVLGARELPEDRFDLRLGHPELLGELLDEGRPARLVLLATGRAEGAERLGDPGLLDAERPGQRGGVQRVAAGSAVAGATAPRGAVAAGALRSADRAERRDWRP